MSRSRVKVKGFTLEFCVGSISPEPFERFSLNFTKMFLSVRQCAEPKTQLCRLKVKVTLQDHVICLQFLSTPYLLNHLNDFHFTQMFLLVRRCAEHMTQLPLEFLRDHTISPEPFCQFSLNFTKMYCSVRWCAAHITQLPRLKINVQGQGQGIYP